MMILKFAIATSSLLVAFLVYNNKSYTTSNIRRQLSFQERFIDPKSTFLRQKEVLFHSSARKCNPDELQKSNEISVDDGDYYKSQMAEDQKLMKWFGTLCGGIEMGALDGVTFSNSYVFNKLLGYKGVLIELSFHALESTPQL